MKITGKDLTDYRKIPHVEHPASAPTRLFSLDQFRDASDFSDADYDFSSVDESALPEIDTEPESFFNSQLNHLRETPSTSHVRRFSK